jgi:enamine deaminase RidA (YjgF/YER057c/UK114 family)
MAAIKHFAAPAGMTTPPLSFAARTGDLLFVSGIPGFDENNKLPDDFEAQFGLWFATSSACSVTPARAFAIWSRSTCC